MNIKQFEALIAVADELHFGRAAKRLRISQSALSQLVARLEASLGVELVARTSREVRLTEAGEIYLPPARQALAEAARADALIAEYREGKVGRVTIGSLGAGLNGPLAPIVASFRALAPGGVVELRHHPGSAAQERLLLSGQLDAAVVRSVVNVRDLVARRIATEAFVVYVNKAHPLSGRRRITLRELAAEPVVIWPREIGAAYYDLVVGACREAGFEPRIEGLGTSLEAQLTLVAAGVGVSIQAASNRSIDRADTVAIDLDPADLQAPLWFVHPRRVRSAAGRHLVAAADLHLSPES